MKNVGGKTLVALFLILISKAVVYGQTTLNFPLLISPSNASYVGLALVNPGTVVALATFTSYAANGQPVNSSAQVVPARGQISKLMSQLFPDNQVATWVRVTSSTSDLQGFMAFGDFVGTVGGIGPPVSATDQILPFVSDTFDFHAVNPNNFPITLAIRFYSAEGFAVGQPINQAIPANGAYRATLLDLPRGVGASYASARYAKVASTGNFATTNIVSNFLHALVGKDWGFVNGVDDAEEITVAATTLNFPHVVTGQVGTASYTTILGITNLLGGNQAIGITFRQQDGTVTTVQRTLPGNGALRQSIDELFPGSGYRDGWVQVTGPSGLTGFAAFVESNQGGMEVVAPQTTGTGSANLIFGHIADLAPWSTGVALLNAGTTAANVQVFALNPDGTLIGGAPSVPTATFTVPAQTKVAKLLQEWIPQTQTRSSDGGFIYIRVTNNVPLYGLELFFLRSGVAFANVPASVVGPATYSPPLP